MRLAISHRMMPIEYTSERDVNFSQLYTSGAMYMYVPDRSISALATN
jgi:hypothetical protein